MIPMEIATHRNHTCGGRQQQEAFSNISENMNRDLLKVFEKYNLGDKSMLCLWRNGYLSCALRERSREMELQTRLSEWLKE
jgi:hypothetical protein